MIPADRLLLLTTLQDVLTLGAEKLRASAHQRPPRGRVQLDLLRIDPLALSSRRGFEARYPMRRFCSQVWSTSGGQGGTA